MNESQEQRQVKTGMISNFTGQNSLVTGLKIYHHKKPFHLKYNNGILQELNIAYETWGDLNEERDNAILLFGGISLSSHAKSHQENTSPGWWEKFIGPGCAVNSDKFFLICTNNLGSCYGTTGPSSINPSTGKEYGTTFPMISVEDIVRVQFLLIDHLGIDKLYTTMGASLGGMSALLSAVIFPNRIRRVISISACAYSHPSAIAQGYLQRQCVMSDPNWNSGNYYGKMYPQMGMKLARGIATVNYRSSHEWERRFGREKINDSENPSFQPYYQIESYLDHQGHSFAMKYDPNSLLYISKAMDMFDIGESFPSLFDGLSRIKCPVMVLGVNTDNMYPVEQQRKLVELLQKSGNDAVTLFEINSIYGHDSFLLDLSNFGTAIKGYLETSLTEYGNVSKSRKIPENKDNTWVEATSQEYDNAY
ncbi:uncharacterized protein LOC144451056 [Glandiceps talaboti]